MAEIGLDQLDSILTDAGKSGISKQQVLDKLRSDGHTIAGQGGGTERAGFIQKYGPQISAAARPALEIGGAVGGGVLGTGAGPLGGAAGGALGYATGESAADLLDRSLGLKKPINGIGQAAKETAGNIQSGAIQEAGGLGLGALEKPLAYTGKGLMSVLFGPSIKAIDARFLENAAIKEAKPFDVLARELPKDVEKLSDSVGELKNTALKSLSKSKAILPAAGDAGNAVPRDTLLKVIEKEKQALGRTVSDANFKAKVALERYAERLSKVGPTVSENELGHIVHDIDHDIDWEKPGNEPLNRTLESMRTKWDGILKARNSGYRDAMVPVAEQTRLLNKSKSLFGIKREGRELVHSNMTSSALKNAGNIMRTTSQDVLDALKAVTGRDYLQASENAHVAEQFVGGRAQGSRMVNLGAALGAGVGGAIGSHTGGGSASGAIMGALGGGVVDRQGGKMAAEVIDQLLKLKKMGIYLPPGLITRSISSALTPDQKKK